MDWCRMVNNVADLHNGSSCDVAYSAFSEENRSWQSGFSKFVCVFCHSVVVLRCDKIWKEVR